MKDKDIKAFLLSPTGERFLRWMEEDADWQIAIGIIVASVVVGLLGLVVWGVASRI